MRLKQEELLQITEQYKSNLLRKFLSIFSSESKYSAIIQVLRQKIKSYSNELSKEESLNLLKYLEKIEKEKLSEPEQKICRELKKRLSSFIQLEKAFGIIEQTALGAKINQLIDSLNELVGRPFVDNNVRRVAIVSGLAVFICVGYQTTSPYRFAGKMFQPLLSILVEKACYMVPMPEIPFKNYLPSMRWFVSLGLQISMDFLSGKDWYFSMAYIFSSALKTLLRTSLNNVGVFNQAKQQYPKTTMLVESCFGYFVYYFSAIILDAFLTSDLKLISKYQPILVSGENEKMFINKNEANKAYQATQTFFYSNNRNSDLEESNKEFINTAREIVRPSLR